MRSYAANEPRSYVMHSAHHMSCIVMRSYAANEPSNEWLICQECLMMGSGTSSWSVLQCVVVCACSVFQRVAVCACSVLQSVCVVCCRGSRVGVWCV